MKSLKVGIASREAYKKMDAGDSEGRIYPGKR